MDIQSLTSGGGDFLESSNRSVAHQLAIVGYTRQKGLCVDAGKLRKRRGQELRGAMDGWSTIALDVVEKISHAEIFQDTEHASVGTARHPINVSAATVTVLA